MQMVWKTEERLQQQSEEIIVIVAVVKEIPALVVMVIGIGVESEAVAAMIIVVEENLAMAGKAMSIVVIVEALVMVVMMAVDSAIGIGIGDILKAEIPNFAEETILRKQVDMEIVIEMNMKEEVEIESVGDHPLARKVRTKGLSAWWLMASRKVWQEAQGRGIRSSGAWRHPR